MKDLKDWVVRGRGNFILLYLTRVFGGFFGFGPCSVRTFGLRKRRDERGGVGHIVWEVGLLRLVLVLKGAVVAGAAILQYDTQIWGSTWGRSTQFEYPEAVACQTSTGLRLASIFDGPWPVGRKCVVGVLACRIAFLLPCT